MRVSHEVPLSLLEQSRSFNSFDYCLSFLLDKYPVYKDFFIKSRELGRTVFLDNSVFELEKAALLEDFYKAILLIKPTYYIIPDVLENCEATIKNIEDWCFKYGSINGLKIGVVQGKTFEELVQCYRACDKLCDVVAISFDYSYYLTTVPESVGTIEERYSRGRIKFIQALVRLGIINHNKWHHCLGCYTPQEMLSYKTYTFIKSVDTSNPIVHAIKGIRYTPYGLKIKEKMKMCDLMGVLPEQINQELLNYNISMFKEFCS